MNYDLVSMTLINTDLSFQCMRHVFCNLVFNTKTVYMNWLKFFIIKDIPKFSNLYDG